MQIKTIHEKYRAVMEAYLLINSNIIHNSGVRHNYDSIFVNKNNYDIPPLQLLVNSPPYLTLLNEIN